ncbi:MAG TPA: hypothetical protein VKX45_11610, partial [Bryobacteraceae bacterium]|nr:hypothetical protein [Bryobacteraceae bacterium]
MRNILGLSAVSLWAGLAWGQTPAFSTPVAQRAFLNQYCAYCHNDKLKSGSMTLTALDLEHIDRTAELAEKMVRKL